MGQVLPVAALTEALAAVRADKRVVTTNGCFDLLHVGHLRYLQAARAMGDLLVVAVNSDASVRALKGPTRPVVAQADRAELLAGLACVDYVVIFDAPTPVSVLQQIRPDIHVKGGDYDAQSLPEGDALRALGTTLAFVPLVADKSTTALVGRLRTDA